MMEGFQRRRKSRGTGGRKAGAGQGRDEAFTNEILESVCVHAAVDPVLEITYLQRLNKTSLCQTIQGMAGHSLCGVKGRG